MASLASMLLLLVLFLPNKHYTLSLVTSEIDVIVVVKSNQMALRGNTQLHSSVQLLIAVRSSFWLTSPRLLVASQWLLAAPQRQSFPRKLIWQTWCSLHTEEKMTNCWLIKKKKETFFRLFTVSVCCGTSNNDFHHGLCHCVYVASLCCSTQYLPFLFQISSPLWHSLDRNPSILIKSYCFGVKPQRNLAQVHFLYVPLSNDWLVPTPNHSFLRLDVKTVSQSLHLHKPRIYAVSVVPHSKRESIKKINLFQLSIYCVFLPFKMSKHILPSLSTLGW